MAEENIRLPNPKNLGRKKRKKNLATDLFSREGNTELGHRADRNVLPVGLDPDVMDQLLKEIMLRENEEQLEAMEETRLPPVGGMLPSPNGIPPQ